MFTNPGQLLAGFVIPHHHLWPWQCAHLKGMVVIGEGVDDRHTAVARQLLQVPGRGPPPRGGGGGREDTRAERNGNDSLRSPLALVVVNPRAGAADGARRATGGGKCQRSGART